MVSGNRDFWTHPKNRARLTLVRLYVRTRIKREPGAHNLQTRVGWSLELRLICQSSGVEQGKDLLVDLLGRESSFNCRVNAAVAVENERHG